MPEKKSDEEAISEYLDDYNLPGNLRLIASNALAFPNAKDHTGKINRLLRQNRHAQLLDYLEHNDCLKDGITSIEVLRQYFEDRSFP